MKNQDCKCSMVITRYACIEFLILIFQFVPNFYFAAACQLYFKKSYNQLLLLFARLFVVVRPSKLYVTMGLLSFCLMIF